MTDPESTSELEMLRKANALLERRLARSETARAEAEALVEERGRFLASHNEQFLRTLLDSLSQGIVVFDRQRKLASCNQVYVDMLGASSPLVASGKFADLDEGDALDVETVFRRNADGGNTLCSPVQAAEPGTYDYMLRDGRAFEVSVVSLGARGIAKSFTDVSPFYATQRQLEDAHRKAVSADQSKSRFLAMMSHDIRTPMNAMLAMLELLSIANLDAKEARQVALAHASGEQLLFLLADIIEVARADGWSLELKAEPVHLGEFAPLVCDAWKALAQRKGLQLEMALSADLPEWIASDSTRLRQLLDNLISNAIKYTQSGSISVAFSSVMDGSDAVLHVSVTDTGRGISTDQQQHLFRDMRRIDNPLEPAEEGTGLGLAICRRITGGMGGTIGVESEPGQGSRFWFRIPLIVSSAKSAPTGSQERVQPVPPLGDPARQPHLLVAEDVEANRIVIAALLDELHITHVMVEDGEQAVALFDRLKHDAILMDVSMPNMDGAQATRLIRAAEGQYDLDQAVPIIGVTAFVGADEKQVLLQSGMNAILPKPVRLAVLRQTLMQALFGSAEESVQNRRRRGPAPVPQFLSAHVVDEKLLGEQLALLPPESRDRLKDTIIRDIEAWHAKFIEARLASDEEALSRSHHALTGICGGFGARVLLTSLSEIRVSQADMVTEKLPDHMKLFDATKRALRDFNQ